MKKSPHVIWVCPSNGLFFRTKGEVRPRPNSVLSKLLEKGIKLNILIPYDATLLPKTKIGPGRVTRHNVELSQKYPVDIIKLTRGAISPGVYMAKLPPLEPALESAVFSKAALAFASQLKKPVDVFHLFEWETALLPLFLEMEKNGNRVLRNARTFLSVHSLHDQGNFAPALMAYLGIPETLFHPDGVEFYGKLSYLKTGLLFSDGVGIIETTAPVRGKAHRNGTGLEGVLDQMSFKLRRWASDRSLKAHVDAYRELMQLEKSGSILPRLMKKVQSTQDEANRFIEQWGPEPPERYNVNSISFLCQSPVKAYAFWEWTRMDFADYGLMLENRSTGAKKLLSRGLHAFSDYWIDVEPDKEYVLELVGWTSAGVMQPLLRSRALRTPRNKPSNNVDAVFVDVRNRQRYMRKVGDVSLLSKGLRPGGTSAWEWIFSGPATLREGSFK